MRRIIVEPDQLLSCADRMEQTNQDYVRSFTELFAVVDALAAGWKGKDNTAFTNRISKFNGDFKQLSLLCGQYTEFLRNSARAYKETQDELESQAGQLVQ